MGSAEKTLQLLAQFNQYNSAASRRDKWFRLIQYCSKFTTTVATGNLRKLEIMKKLKGAEAAAGDARKLFRIVGSADYLQKAIESWLKVDSDIVVQIFETLGYIGRVLWLLHDHGIWLTKAGIMKRDLEMLNYRSAVCWLFALGLLLVRDLRNLTLLDGKFQKLKKTSGATTSEISQIKVQLQNGRFEFWKDFLDMFIPLAKLGRVNPKIGAFCGVLSTVIAIRHEWNKVGNSMFR